MRIWLALLISAIFLNFVSAEDMQFSYNWFWPLGLTMTLIFLVFTLVFFVTEWKLNTIVIILLSLIFFIVVTNFVADISANFPHPIPFERVLDLSSGYAAFFVLALTLMIGPVARIFKSDFFYKLLRYRRNLGVMSFILTFLHILLVLRVHWESSLINFFRYYFPVVHGGVIFNLGGLSGFSIILVIIAFILLFILALSSNNLGVKILGRYWKPVQRLAYLIFILSFVHTILFKLILRNSILFSFIFYFSAILVVVLQVVGFFVTILEKNRKAGNSNEILRSY